MSSKGSKASKGEGSIVTGSEGSKGGIAIRSEGATIGTIVSIGKGSKASEASGASGASEGTI